MGDSPRAEARTLGRYELLAGMATGGMAELYLGSFHGPGGHRKLVALKRILPDVQANERFARMFCDEANITARLTHPSVAQAYELGESDHELFLSMELVLGIDLARILRTLKKSQRGRLPIGLCCKVMHDVCLALDSAHRHRDEHGSLAPIIHRDVTPKNLMVTFDGCAKVIDFGIAHAKDRLERTMAGVVKGTAAYMSPEQLRGDRLDGRSDLYSAGATLHEMLTGERLFGEDAGAEQRALSSAAPSASTINPEVSRPLADVVQRALARDPQRRYDSGREMATALIAAAGELFFGQDQVANYLRSTFRDRFAQTRALVNLDPPTGHAPIPRPLTTDPTIESLEVTEPKFELSTPVERAGQTVMVVHDHPEQLLAIQAALKQESYRVISCAFPERALAQAVEHTPQMTIIAAKPWGFELCRALRERPETQPPPVLFVSPECSLAERTRGIESGGDAFIRSPIEPVELCRQVADQLQSTATMKALLAPHRWRKR